MVKNAMSKANNHRRAVAMIELIFAIVVMGFAMLAIPNITAQAAKSSQSAINQEAIVVVASNMQSLLSLQWTPATGGNGEVYLEDYNGKEDDLELTENKNSYADKKMQINYSIGNLNNLQYTFDATSIPNNADLKSISISLSSTETTQEDKNVILHAFSCNINPPIPTTSQLP
jgi:Tfp pilus assembly protein PilV